MSSHGGGHPVDRGWAWMVLMGGFFVHFFTFGYVKSFGVLFIEIQNKFSSTSSMTSVITGVFNLSFSLSTLIVVNVLMKRFSVRSLCFVGAIFQGLGLALSTLVTDVGVFILTLGVLFGIGQALLYCPTMVIINEYFVKRKTIAISFACCGVSAGGVAYPFMSRYLVDTYGLSSTFLLLGAVALQQCICAVLYRPPESYSIPRKSNQLISTDNGKTYITDEALNDKVFLPLQYKNNKDENQHEALVSYSVVLRENGIGNSHKASIITDDEDEGSKEIPLLANDIPESKSIETENEESCDWKKGIDGDKEFCTKQNNRESPEDLVFKTNSKPTFRCRIPKLIKSVSFWLVAVFYACGGISSTLYSVYIPPLMKEKQFTNQEVSIGLTVSSILECLGRFLPGLILQLGFMRPTTIVIGPLLTCAVLFHLTSLVSDLVLMLCLTGAWGFLTGFFWSIQSLIVIEVFGAHRLGSALSIYVNFLGIGSGVSYPIAGSLRDSFGTYSASYHYLGIMYWIASSSMIVIQFILRRNKRKNEELVTPS